MSRVFITSIMVGNSTVGPLSLGAFCPISDTRFLGDLYQDLSERARKKYALLQTPEFVEEFILDRTLDPAVEEFGLEKVRLIAPTCGSGHFLLGTFARLYGLWIKREANELVAVQKALDGVWGVDINPFAVARFRLIVASLNACGILKLSQAPGWNVHLATGDHHQKPQLTTVFGAIGNEVVRPDMVLVECLVSDAAVLAAAELQASSAMLFPRDLHLLSLPKAMDSLLIYTPITFDQ